MKSRNSASNQLEMSQNAGVVLQYGEFWAREPQNLKRLKEQPLRKVRGIYALYNGTMPVYFGEGKLHSRLRQHDKNRLKRHYWDHFSWFEIKNKLYRKEIESLLLRILPFYARSLNRQSGHFESSTSILPKGKNAVKLRIPKYGTGRKRSK